jgi:hypothetical protein
MVSYLVVVLLLNERVRGEMAIELYRAHRVKKKKGKVSPLTQVPGFGPIVLYNLIVLPFKLKSLIL